MIICTENLLVIKYGMIKMTEKKCPRCLKYVKAYHLFLIGNLMLCEDCYMQLSDHNTRKI